MLLVGQQQMETCHAGQVPHATFTLFLGQEVIAEVNHMTEVIRKINCAHEPMSLRECS